MAITIRKQADAEVTSPNPARVSYYVDGTGTAKTKNSAGSVTPTVPVDGSPIVLADQVSAPSTEPGNVKVYAKDVSGTSEAFFLDGAGNEIQISSAGGLDASSTPTTWFTGQNTERLEISYPGGFTPQTTSTTNALPLNASQLCKVLVRYNLIDGDGTFRWLGWRSHVFGWQGGVPSLPESIDNLTWYVSDANAGIAVDIFNDLSLLADGRIQFTIALPFTAAGSVQVCLSAFDLPFGVA